MARNILIEIRANASQAVRELNAVSSAFARFGGQIRGIAGLTSQSMTGIRQMAQGVQNLGFVLSGFVSLPVASAMKNIAEEALTFERAMVEVQKTTGLANTPIKELGASIRDLSKTTPTTAIELANIASEAGRAGIGLGNILAGNIEAAKAEIMEFTRVVDMMAISTTLSTEEAATAFGRFISIFDDVDTTNIENVGSAINELGQAFSINEQQIVGAMMRAGAAMGQLDIGVDIIAAYSAVLTQSSESASRAGNRLRVAFENMQVNFDKAADFLGISAGKMKKMIAEDAAGAFDTLLKAIASIKDPTEASTTMIEIFGRTGKNAVERLVAVYPDLQRAIEISSTAFAEGTSLQTEFNRAINATLEQLKILKNNLIDVGAAFVEDLLPMAKEIIGALIPAMQDLSKFVGALPMKTKLLVVAFGALLVVGLPLLALLGSFGFAISMFLNGIVNLVAGVGGLLISMASLVFSGNLVTLAIVALVSALGVTLVAAVGKATGTFDAIIDKLKQIAENAKGWGENIVAEIAGGIVSAAATILINALTFVGNIISSFLESHSAPKVGPLSTMGNWGKALMETFMRSFKDADFGVLRTVTSTVRSFFQAMVDAGEMAEKELGPALLRVRALVAQLISLFNTTGEISVSILGEIARQVGEVGAELAKLLRLQLEYNRALRELEEIRRRQEDIKEGYEAEVRAIQNRTDLTIAEKMALIRQAREKKNLLMDNAKTEEGAAKRNVDGLKSQLDWQQQYVDALVEQKSIWADAIAAIKRAASAMDSLGRKVKDVLGDLLAKLEINKKMQAEYEKAGISTKGLLREELNIRKNIVAELLKIKDPTEDQKQLLDDNLARIKEIEGILGAEAGYDWPDWGLDEAEGDLATFKQAIDDVVEKVKSFKEIFSEGARNYAAFMAGLGGDVDFPEEQFMAGEPISESERKFYGWGQTIFGAIGKVKDAIQDVKDAWQDLMDFFSGTDEEGEATEGVFGEIGTAINDMGLLVIPALLSLAAAARLLLPFLVKVGTTGATGLWGLATSGGSLTATLAALNPWLAGLALILATLSVGVIVTLAQNWEEYGPRLETAMNNTATAAEDFKDRFLAALNETSTGAEGEGDDLENAKNIIGGALKGITDAYVGAVETVSGLLGLFTGPLGGAIGNFIAGIATAFEGGKDVIAEFTRLFLDLSRGADESTLANDMDNVSEAISRFVGGFSATIWAPIGGTVETTMNVLTRFIEEVEKKFGETTVTQDIKDFAADVKEQMGIIQSAFVTGEWLDIVSTGIEGILAEINTQLQDLTGLDFGKLFEVSNIQMLVTAALAGVGTAFDTFLRENLPIWASTMLVGLGQIVGNIKTWFTTEALPGIESGLAGLAGQAIGGLVSSLQGALQQEGQRWPGTVREFFSSGFKDLFGPEAVGDFSTSFNTIIMQIMTDMMNYKPQLDETWKAILGAEDTFESLRVEWGEKLGTALGELLDSIAHWITFDAVPAISGLVEAGKTILETIGTIWPTTVEDALGFVKDAFETGFGIISAAVAGKVVGMVNKVLDFIEKGVNWIIDEINDMIKEVNKIAKKLGLGELDEIARLDLPRLAKGGIAMQPMIAEIGEVPEAIIPLSRLGDMFNNFQGTQPVNINIYNPVVRNDDDLNVVVETIQRQLGMKLNAKLDLRSRAMGR